MTTQATATTEGNSKVREAFKTAEKIAATGIDVAVLKKRVESAVEDAVTDAQRMAKHGRHALEDAIDETTYRIKKNPWQSVGYAAGAGFGIGLIVGWLMRRPNARDH